MNKIVNRAIVNSLSTAVYIALVASFMFFLQSHSANQEDTIITVVSALLLFVCSAAITGFLVLGKPAMLYVDGKRKEAVLLLGYTIGILFIITIITFSFLLIMG